MKCPYCGKDGKHKVVRTTQCADGVIRERICPHCGIKNVSTEQFDKPEPVKKDKCYM